MNRKPYRLRRKDLRSFSLLQSLPFIISDYDPAGWRKLDELVIERFKSLAAQQRAFSARLHAWLKQSKEVGLAVIGIGPEKVFVGVFEAEQPSRRRRYR
jgi:hypothetical protein